MLQEAIFFQLRQQLIMGDSRLFVPFSHGGKIFKILYQGLKLCQLQNDGVFLVGGIHDILGMEINGGHDASSL